MSIVFPINEDPRFRLITGSAGQTMLSVGFPFQANADIAIFRRADEDADWVKLDLPDDYTLTGAGATQGGAAVLVTPSLEAEKFAVVGMAVLARLSSITQGGRFRSELTDAELDRIRIIQQEQSRDIGRALKMDFGETGLTVASDIPDGSTLVKDGDRIVAGINPDASAAAAAASAAAALASQEAAALSEFNAQGSATEAQVYADLLNAAIYDFSFDSDPEAPGYDWSV